MLHVLHTSSRLELIKEHLDVMYIGTSKITPLNYVKASLPQSRYTVISQNLIDKINISYLWEVTSKFVLFR